MTDPSRIELYRCKNLPEAHAIRAVLEDAGIAADVDGEMLQGVAGEVPFGWNTAPRVMVSADQAEDAAGLVRKYLALQQANAERRSETGDDDADHCLSCGEELAEDEVACAACGWTYEDEEDL